jgi:hypothetical protein
MIGGINKEAKGLECEGTREEEEERGGMVGVDVLVIDWAGGRMMYSCNLHKFS